MSKKAEWIWNRGDYAIRLLNESLTSRYEREVFVPPFWHMDDFCKNVKFIKTFRLARPERIRILASGKFNVIVDRTDDPKNAYVRDFKGYIDLDPGEYRMTVSVYNEAEIPALFVEGETVRSGEDFLVTTNDFNYAPAGCEGLTDPACPPGSFRYSYEETPYTLLPSAKGELLLDCGREMMGVVSFGDCTGEGEIRIFYGESEEEARDEENCELTDRVSFPSQTRPPLGKAFRYIKLRARGVELGGVKVFREFVPQPRAATLTCSDKRLEKIFSVAEDTLALNIRDFFLDGIKRDRWVWGGDMYQTCLMNYYSFFDLRTERRTLAALAGKPPMPHFLNHIMEYSFYWIIAVYEHSRYAGDAEFVREMFPAVKRIIEFAHTRRTESGMLEGREGDWIFVDWADLDNRGEVAAEQLIYLKALKTAAELCRIAGEDPAPYEEEFASLKRTVFETLWDEERGVFCYSRVNGVLNRSVKRQPHIFALLYGLLDEKQEERVLENVLLNDSVEKIVTPFMRFFELSALCKAGQTDYVYKEIESYWGGMLDEGATSFWELYDSSQKGSEKYSMYGRKYGKSLCHAWGASPLYLLGKYFIGLEPAEPGYKSFRLAPRLTQTEKYSVCYPLPAGEVSLSYDGSQMRVSSSGAGGLLYLDKNLYDVRDSADAAEGNWLVFRIADGEERRLSAGKR